MIEEDKLQKEEKNKEKEADTQNKQLKNIFIVLGVIGAVFLIGVFFIYSLKSFEYKGVDFKIIKEGDLVLYNTFFEMQSITGQHVGNYNLYFRNDPRNLEKIPFEGEINLEVALKKMVIKMDDSAELNCEGNGVIAIANLVNSFGLLGIEVIKDENVSCDSEGRYMYVDILQGEESKIEQYGPSCYKLIVSDCKILEVTEKFIIDSIVENKVNKL